MKIFGQFTFIIATLGGKQKDGNCDGNASNGKAELRNDCLSGYTKTEMRKEMRSKFLLDIMDLLLYTIWEDNWMWNMTVAQCALGIN